MQRSPRLLLLVTLLLLGAASLIAEPTAPESPPVEPTGYPEIDFRLGTVPFDLACARISGRETPKEWVEELDERKPEFVAAWRQHGPRLLAATVEALGVGWRQREMIATMTLCRIPSMSLPLLVSMRHFLRSARGEEADEMFHFVGLVYHELLHTYLVDNLESSALQEKYADEPPRVRSHLHLFAVMKSVYTRLGRAEELEKIQERTAVFGRDYQRALAIVDEEGAEPFLAEIRGAVYADEGSEATAGGPTPAPPETPK